MKKLLVLIVLLALTSPALASSFFPAGGNDNWIIGKAGDEQEENDYHHKFINIGRHNELLGIDLNSATTWTPKGNYAPSTHTHTVSQITDITTYKIPTAAMADTGSHCKAAEHSKDGTQAATADAATECKHCVSVDLAEIANTSGNGLPSGEINASSIMMYDGAAKKFAPSQQQLLPNAGALIPNGILITDDKGKPKLASKAELFEAAQKEQSGLLLWGWISVGLFGLGIVCALWGMILWLWVPTKGNAEGDEVVLKDRYTGEVKTYVVGKCKWYPGTEPIVLTSKSQEV